MSIRIYVILQVALGSPEKGLRVRPTMVAANVCNQKELGFALNGT